MEVNMSPTGVAFGYAKISKRVHVCRIKLFTAHMFTTLFTNALSVSALIMALSIPRYAQQCLKHQARLPANLVAKVINLVSVLASRSGESHALPPTIYAAKLSL